MIYSVAAPHGGTVLYRTESRARRGMRKRVVGLLVVVGVAASGGVITAFHAQSEFQAHTSSASAEMLPPGPFSYFPH